MAEIQAMLEARMGVEELPSWVFFPDKERAEWVNTMLKQVYNTLSPKIKISIFDNQFSALAFCERVCSGPSLQNNRAFG